MKARKTRLALAMMAAVVAVTALTANAESFTYEGRYLGSDGQPVANTTKPATLKVYTSETASSDIGAAQITIATDSEGYFATTADVALSGADGADTFWLGVTPEGGSEIRPRMRVSPAPFAIRAASARVLEVDGDLKLDGTVTITTLTNADKLIPNTIVTSKPLSIDKAGLENVRNLTIGEISRANYGKTDSLSILRTGNGAVPNFYWDQFPAEEVLSVSVSNVEAKGKSSKGQKEITATADGVALIMVRTYVVIQGSTYAMRRWSFGATLSNGLTYFLYRNGFDRGEISDAKVNGHRSNEHYYLWSVPVVRGKNLTIELEPWINSYGVMHAEAKIQFVYFGAAK